MTVPGLLSCAICLYDPAKLGQEPNEAITVIEGYAVCYSHLGYLARGERFAAVLRAVKDAALEPYDDEDDA